MDVVLEIGLSNALATAVLAVAAVAIAPLCRRRPALVHGLWLLVLLKLLTPPLVRIPLSWPAPAAPTPELAEPSVPEPPPQTAPPAAVVLLPPPSPSGPSEPTPAVASKEPAVLEANRAAPPAEEPGPAAAAPWPWREILGGGWLAGSCGWLLLAGWRLWRFGGLLAHARPGARPLRERAAELAGRLGLRRAPEVWLMPGRLAPLLWWLGGRPRLLLPAELPARLSSEGLDTVLMHELAHLRRRDHWVRGLELLAMGLYWWHPVVWYARRELREAEEQCCDAWVVTTLPGAGRLYATTLLDTLDFLSHEGPAVPLLASGLGPVTDLKRRLTMTGKRYWVERQRPATALPGSTPPAPGVGPVVPPAPTPELTPPQAPGAGLPTLPTPGTTTVGPVPAPVGPAAGTTPPVPARGPQPVPFVPEAARGNTATDPRIDRLERQMEKILQRLDELQKERGTKPPAGSSSPEP